MEPKGGASEGSEGNEERVIGDWKEEDPCNVRAGKLAQLWPTVM